MTNTSRLSVENLNMSFGGLKVIQDLNFTVAKGQVTALIGPNGAGKTTAFNLISGALRPVSGRVLVDGQDITNAPSRERIFHGVARSFQNIRLMPHLTVFENLLLGQHPTLSGGVAALLKPFRLQRNCPWRASVNEALEEYGLADRANHAVASLPYGLRKRIDLIRAVLASPKLLLLDEPAAGLNPSETTQLLEHLEKVRAKGVDLLVIEHDMSFIKRLCEQVIVLNFGQKIAEGSLAEIQQNQQVREAYLGTAA